MHPTVTQKHSRRCNSSDYYRNPNPASPLVYSNAQQISLPVFGYGCLARGKTSQASAKVLVRRSFNKPTRPPLFRIGHDRNCCFHPSEFELFVEELFSWRCVQHDDIYASILNKVTYELAAYAPALVFGQDRHIVNHRSPDAIRKRLARTNSTSGLFSNGNRSVPKKAMVGFMDRPRMITLYLHRQATELVQNLYIPVYPMTGYQAKGRLPKMSEV